MTFGLAGCLEGEDLLGVVMTWGIVSVLLWFLLSALRRGHHGRITRIRISIEEIKQAGYADGEIGEALDEVIGHLQEAENLGPLRGRRPLSAAHGAMAALVQRVEQEIAADEDVGADGDGGDRENEDRDENDS